MRDFGVDLLLLIGSVRVQKRLADEAWASNAMFKHAVSGSNAWLPWKCKRASYSNNLDAEMTTTIENELETLTLRHVHIQHQSSTVQSATEQQQQQQAQKSRLALTRQSLTQSLATCLDRCGQLESRRDS